MPFSKCLFLERMTQVASTMISQSRYHGWGTTQLLMDPAQIVGASNQIHAPLHGLQALTSMPASARESSQSFAHRCIEAFNEGRVDLLASS